MTETSRVTDDERAILELLTADSSAFHSCFDLARHIGVTGRVAQDAIRRLIGEGLLTQTWAKASGSGHVHQPEWRLTDAGRDALGAPAP